MMVLICGSRDWNNFKIIEDFILTLPKDTIIVEGDCKGADKISGYLGRQHGYRVIPVTAQWEKYGDAAGPIRNQEMLDLYKPELVVAFHNDIENSRGTKDMVTRATRVGIEVKIITESNLVSASQ